MKKVLLLLLIVGTIDMYSQKITEEVFSPKLNENREITIGLPASYLKNPDKKYPLLVIIKLPVHITVEIKSGFIFLKATF